MLKDVTQTGTSIHTTDSADWYGDLNVDGFSRQNTRSGKNKINIQDGTATDTVLFDITDKLTVGQTYSFGAFLDLTNSSVNGRIRIDLYDNEENYTYHSGNTKSAGSTGISTVENLTIPNNTVQIKIAIQKMASGTFSCKYSEVMCNEGSTLDDYEAYGVSPSPDYPTEIRNLEGVNYFNAYEIPSSTGIVVEDKGETIKMPVASAGNGYVSTGKTLRELCPKLKVGDIVYLQFIRNLPSNNNFFIYLTTPALTWGVRSFQVITEEMLNSGVALYGNRYSDRETTQCILSGFRITKEISDEFAPYNTCRIKQTGKQLFDKNKAIIGGYYGTNGTIVANQDYFLSQEYIDVRNYTTLQYKGSSDNGDVARIMLYDENKKLFDYYLAKNRPVNVTSASYIRIADRLEYLDTLQVKNDTVADYEPYQETIIDFPLQEGQKMYEGSTLTDEGITHIRKKIVFDGTENWSMYSDTPGKYYCTTKRFGRETGYENPSTFKCTHFTPSIGTATTNGISSTKFATYINMDTTTITDLSSFKTWLSNNNVLVEYELAESEIIPYTEAQQTAYNELQNIDTYQYVNNIELIANEETNMTFNYKQDIQMQIKEEINPVKQAVIALGGVIA